MASSASSTRTERSSSCPAGLAPKGQIKVLETASNMKGVARAQSIIPVKRVNTPFGDVFDVEARKLAASPPTVLSTRSKDQELKVHCNAGSLVQGDD